MMTPKWTKIYLEFGDAAELRLRFRAGKTSLSLAIVFLLTFPRRFLCCRLLCFASVVSYVAFVCSLFIYLLFFFSCLAKAVITKTYLYNFDPLKPHFYIVKLGFTGVYIIFLISAQKHRLWVLVRTASPCGYSLEPPRRGGTNGYPQSIY